MNGVGEFDGQNALIFYNGAFRLFVRGNASSEGGYRCVLCATSTDLKQFSAFKKIVFPGMPDAANVYFAHAYRVHDSLMLVMPVAYPDGDAKISGIHAAVSHPREDSDLHFEASKCILPTRSKFRGRTSDVNVAGCSVDEDGQTLILIVHRNAADRLDYFADPTIESLSYWIIDISRFAPGGAPATCAGASAPSASLVDAPMSTQTTSQPVQDARMSEELVLDGGQNGVIDFGDKDPEESPTARHATTKGDLDELPIVREALCRRIAYLKDAGDPNGSLSGLKQCANGWWFDMPLPKCECRTSVALGSQLFFQLVGFVYLASIFM